MPEELVAELRARGHKVEQTGELADGLRAADVVYATRIQQERLPAGFSLEGVQEKFAIDAALYDRVCRPGTVLMHPLPRDSRNDPCELSGDLNRHPALAIFRQTDNGIPVRMALFALVLGVADQVDATARDAHWYRPDRFGVDDTRPMLT